MEEKKSILKEALTEYQEMIGAANKLAPEKLSKEFPEKFNSYLKEELNKTNTKESDTSDEKRKESTNKLDEGSNKNREETMKNEKKETQERVKKEPKETKEVVAENYDYETELDDVDLRTKEYGADIPDGDREHSERGRPTDSETEPDDYMLKDIESEIDKMELMEKELQERDQAVTHDDSVSFSNKNSGGVAFDELVKIKNMLDEILDKADEKEFNDNSSENFVDEDDSELSDDELDELLEEITNDDMGNEFDPDLDEQHGITHSTRKKVTGKLPRKGQGLPTSHEPQLRYAMQEAERKVKNLIETNKKSTKSLNENKKKVRVLRELVEGYKGALEKYRDQLKSMSVFNTNLAHVNNVLVNEELALTQDDKIRVINEFKELNSIAKSEKKYKEILNEFKNVDKKKINENLGDKLNKSSSVQSSSKKALEEVIEKTAYENNEHISRIKKINEFLDKRTSKKII